MDIERAVRRDLERARRQDQSVGRNDQGFRSRGSEAIERALVFQGLRLKDLQAAACSKLLDGTRRRTQAAACGPIRLREHQRDMVAGIKQRRQRARRKLWSTGEY